MGWHEAVDKVLAKAARRVLVLGATDVGKSSFCRALIAAAAEQGRAATLIDSDLGQKMVGPPAAVTRSEPGRPDRLDRLAFVGTTDPVRGLAGVVRGAGDLTRSSPADLTVINTSGLVSGIGRRLKREKIRATCPDLIVAIVDGPALQSILSDHPELRILHLEPPPGVRRKTEGERRAARREAFRAYFEGAGTWEMPALEPNCVSLTEGQLLGLRDADGCDLAIGIAVATGAGEGLSVLAPEVGRNAATAITGAMVLDSSFGEVQRARPGA